MVNHGKAFHNYYIPCFRKYRKQSGNRKIIVTRAAHDKKVGCNAVQYKTAFLCSDWLYFLSHGVKIHISYKKQELTPAEIRYLET